MRAIGPSGAPGPVLETERLVLRPLRRGDVPAIVELAGDEAVASMTARIPHPYGRDEVEAWFEGQRAAAAAGAELVLGIERRSDGAFLGAIGLEPRQDDSCTVGFWLGRPYWNQGVMTEALRRVLAYAFEEAGCTAVEAGAFPENGASLRVQEKAGLRPLRRQRQPAPARGGDREVLIYGIRREAWRR